MTLAAPYPAGEVGGTAFLDVTRSIGGRAWRLRPADDALAGDIARRLGAPDALGRLLASRGVTLDEAEHFLKPVLKREFPDPSSFADMDAGAACVADAVQSGGCIGVFADYDVDGATSAAQLIRFFRAIGVETELHVPDREKEGYGPSGAALLGLKERGCSLVITVDCGAAAHAALDEAAEGGLDVVVLDHHLMEDESPRAAALVNPNRADCGSGQGHLAAAGVTFVFLAALARELRRRDFFTDQDQPDLLALLDLAALGTICDMVALTGVNRAIVAQGLKVMGGLRNSGLAALAGRAGVSGPFGEYHCGFIFGPRINAGGRIGRSDLGARLLSTDDASEAAKIAEELERLNGERKQIESETVEDAVLQADRQVKSDTEPPIIIVSGKGWPPGVVGLAASRLKERYNRPALVLGIDETGLARGSGRSVKGVNLGAAIAAARKAGIAESGGGHAMAAGISLAAERINALSEFLNTALANQMATALTEATLHIDAALGAASVTPELLESMSLAGPFGSGNPEPVYVIADLRVAYAERVGGAHVRVSFEDMSGRRVNGIAFRAGDTAIGEALLTAGERRLHAAVRLKLDEWNGRRKADAHIVDLAWR